jgi:sugar phosphate isomerase/epimerase
MAHAKDVISPETGQVECRRLAAGKGLLDYEYYMQQLAASRFDGALVMHDLSESEIEGCRLMIEKLLPAAVS